MIISEIGAGGADMEGREFSELGVIGRQLVSAAIPSS